MMIVAHGPLPFLLLLVLILLLLLLRLLGCLHSCPSWLGVYERGVAGVGLNG